MPRLWNETIETHRREVRDAILTTTVALVLERGLLSVTMSQIAEETGIGRATLYKYFTDIDAILAEWHAQEIGRHMHRLSEAADHSGKPGERLAGVLRAYAGITHQPQGHLDAELVRLLHSVDDVAHARGQVRELLSGLIAEAADSGVVRADVTSDELADFCLHALSAAGDLPSQEAVDRLVTVTMAGLRADVGGH